MPTSSPCTAVTAKSCSLHLSSRELQQSVDFLANFEGRTPHSRTNSRMAQERAPAENERKTPAVALQRSSLHLRALQNF